MTLSPTTETIRALLSLYHVSSLLVDGSRVPTPHRTSIVPSVTATHSYTIKRPQSSHSKQRHYACATSAVSRIYRHALLSAGGSPMQMLVVVPYSLQRSASVYRNSSNRKGSSPSPGSPQDFATISSPFSSTLICSTWCWSSSRKAVYSGGGSV